MAKKSVKKSTKSSPKTKSKKQTTHRGLYGSGGEVKGKKK